MLLKNCKILNENFALEDRDIYIRDGKIAFSGEDVDALDLTGLTVIPGLIDIKVQTEGLASSNADVMLDSTFVDEQALKTYASHPAHVKVADNNVRPFTKSRVCMDFEA